MPVRCWLHSTLIAFKGDSACVDANSRPINCTDCPINDMLLCISSTFVWVCVHALNCISAFVRIRGASLPQTYLNCLSLCADVMLKLQL